MGICENGIGRRRPYITPRFVNQFVWVFLSNAVAQDGFWRRTLRTERLLLAAALLLAATAPAYAYIDPGSGSVLATAVIGFFAAIGYTMRKYYYKAKDAAAGLFRKPSDK